MTTTPSASELLARTRPPCADEDHVTFDSTDLHDHLSVRELCMTSCAGRQLCEDIGRAHRASGTWGGKMLRNGRPVVEKIGGVL